VSILNVRGRWSFSSLVLVTHILVAALVFLLYDILLTLNDEVRHNVISIPGLILSSAW